MSATWTEWLARVLATDVPAQPALWLAQLWLNLGWGVVLAWLGAVACAWWSVRRGLHVGVAAALAVWTWLPGAVSPAYWLGMAFQSPSLLTVLLCACSLGGRLLQRESDLQRRALSRSELLLAVAGALLGWALVLDTFAVLPVELYAWGFSPLAAAVVLALALLPWVLVQHAPRGLAWMPALAILLFVALRLPTGNAWDAMLDPWLWLALQVWLVRAVWNRY